MSKQLPYPNFNPETNNYEFTKERGVDSIDITNELLTSRTPFEATVKILNRIYDSGIDNVKLYYDEGTGKEDWIDRISSNISSHNTQPNSDSELLQGSKNFIFNTIYQITNNLKNHIAAYSPIAMTDPQRAAEKSKEGEKIKRVTTFTPTTKYNLFYANMAGKEGIGISAVGQKVFLAATQYFNQEAQRLSKLPNLTVEDLKASSIYFNNIFNIYRSMKDNQGKDVNKLVRVFANTLANINLDNAPNVRRVLDEAIEENRAELMQGRNLTADDIDAVSSKYIQTDKSLVISAVISAATDNAKELILDKINANPDLMGTYIYLIINGLEFSDIANLMTSDAVSDIKNAVNVNRMYDESESIDSILKKLDNGLSYNNFLDDKWKVTLRNYIGKLQTDGKVSEIRRNDGKVEKNPSKILNSIPVEELLNIKKDLEESNRTFVEEYSNQDEYEMAQEFREMVSESYLYRESDNFTKGLLRYVGKLIDLRTLRDKLNKDNASYSSFVTAFKSAKEIASLGRILGINGGAKTKLFDRYSFSKVFNDLLSDPLSDATTLYTGFDTKSENHHPDAIKRYNVTKNLIEYANNGDPNLVNFNFDLNKFFNLPEYKNAVIEFYNNYKRAINVFDLIDKLPHYNAFLKAYLVNEDNLKLASIKYNLLMDITGQLETEVMKKSNGTIGKLTDNQFSTIRDYIDELIIKKFLNHENIGIKVKAGDSHFINGVLTEAVTDTIYNLSDDDGLASFKYYMENKVIPMLKNGYTISPNGLRVNTPVLSRNEFLNKLILTDKKSKLDGSPYTHYRSAVNMLNTVDNIEFDKQITAFGAIENITFDGIKLSNLFLIYDLIVNKGRKGQGSLLKILQGSVYNRNSLASRFFQYIGEVDYNTSIPNIKYDLQGDKITLNDVNMDDVKMRLAPVKGSFEEMAMGNKYVKKYDKNTSTYKIQEVTVEMNEGGYPVKKYTDIVLDKNPNYYLFNSNLNTNFAESVNRNKTVTDLVNNVMNLLRTNKIKLIYRCE